MELTRLQDLALASAHSMPLAVSDRSCTLTAPASIPAFASRLDSFSCNRCTSSADSVLGSTTPLSDGPTIASRSSSVIPVSQALSRAYTSAPDSETADVDSPTNRLALSFSVGATESSRSRTTRSDVNVLAFSISRALLPGVYITDLCTTGIVDGTYSSSGISTSCGPRL